ncbi:MAG: hypothetical protein IPO63_02365 [Bacteroidetes bacterium]|nr:hypothetical protein [Bacteroidota bacterium]
MNIVDLRSMKMNPRIAFFFFFLLMGFQGLCTPDTLTFKPAISRLILLGDSVLKIKEDGLKDSLNQEFSRLLDSILFSPTGSSLSFYQVKSLSVAQDPSKKVKAITWMVSKKNGSEFQYFGYLITQLDPKNPSTITRLHQNKDLVRDELEFLKGDSSTWMGCIYYSVMAERYNKKDYFLLLGWAPQSMFTTRKMAEAISITPTKINLGIPVIKAGGKAKTRLILEYNAQVSTSLKYNESKKMIVMDHLSSSDPRPESKGMFQLYGPDLSYDGLKFEKGLWILQRDIDVRNK